MLIAIIKTLRLKQWIKNLILFFPSFLGGKFFELGTHGSVVWLAPLAFCLVSSSGYILNDLLDAESDRQHPQKSRRPVALGQISRTMAVNIGLIVLVIGIFAGVFVSGRFVCLLLAYVLVVISYSLRLKHIPIVDIFCISAGFLLRLESGGVAFQVNISEWLFLNVFLLSIFLSAGKRVGEKALLGVCGGQHRATLSVYPVGFLDNVMIFSGSAVLVTYAMYATIKHSLVYSVPICCLGLLRYLYRVKSGASGDPTESILTDVPLIVVALLWVFIISWSIYG